LVPPNKSRNVTIVIFYSKQRRTPEASVHEQIAVQFCENLHHYGGLLGRVLEMVIAKEKFGGQS
jgi:hypothetical protein